MKDCKKAVEINQAQRTNEKKLHEQLVRELESIINFLYIEVEEKNKFILKLFPEYEINLKENVTVSYFYCKII